MLLLKVKTKTLLEFLVTTINVDIYFVCAEIELIFYTEQANNYVSKLFWQKN